MKPLVSVVVPTHNRNMLLQEALDSVYAQKEMRVVFELEVIVVDDASSDSTRDVMVNYPEARYLRLPATKGPAVARNAGMAASKGSYIAFLDDDDVWLPIKLSLQVPALEEDPEVGAVCSELRQHDGRWVLPRVRPVPSGQVFHRLLMSGNIYGNPAGVLLRRRALEAVGGFDESLPCFEDYDLWLRLAARFPFAFVPGIVALHRTSPHGHYTTGVVDGSRARTMRRIVENALTLLPHDGASQAVKQRARLACGIRLIDTYPIYQAELIPYWVTAVLREFPGLVDSPSARNGVANRVRQFALASAAPLTAAQSFCEDLTTVIAGGASLKDRLRVRRMLGRAWAELAVGLCRAPRPARGAVTSALIRSVLQDPSAVLGKVSGSCWRAAGKIQRHWISKSRHPESESGGATRPSRKIH
jgi:glycosyltransferase involved in cell wall biosynthesis